ncbi:hypothetical protein BJV77DRAFT_711169 [Russula vinacea]|nr:hypothetical protein BJV77DRAFT_711169 [Russula vinacea]
MGDYGKFRAASSLVRSWRSEARDISLRSPGPTNVHEKSKGVHSKGGCPWALGAGKESPAYLPQLHGAPRLCPRCSSQVGRDISAPSGPTGPTSNVTHVNCWSQEDPCYCIAAPNGRDLHCPGLRPSRPFRLHSVASSATQAPAIEDLSTLLTCMHAAKQSSAGGKRGSKGRHGIDTVFSGGPPPLPV